MIKKKKNLVLSSAIIEEGVQIGDDTEVWHYSHIMVSAKVGNNCSIGESVFIGSGVMIGDGVSIANGARIYEGAIIKDGVFIGANAVLKNVKYPRAWREAREYLPTIVEENATIDANAVIQAGVRVGKNATVGAGASVVRDVSEGGFVVSPAAVCQCDRETCPDCEKRKEINRNKYAKRHK